MNIVFYANGKDEVVSKRLQKVIERTVPQERLEIFQTYKDFSKRIQRLPRKIEVAVLLAQSNDQLLELVSLKDYLEDIRIILILPNMERETISKGHLLRPRFVDCTRENFSTVGAVLEKMIESLNNNQINPKGGKQEWQN
jgi:hypothetical protein